MDRFHQATDHHHHHHHHHLHHAWTVLHQVQKSFLVPTHRLSLEEVDHVVASVEKRNNKAEIKRLKKKKEKWENVTSADN
jgi:hypothetical protein